MDTESSRESTPAPAAPAADNGASVGTPGANVGTPPNPFLALIAAAAAWGVPGLGHVLLRRWGKALTYFLAVGALALAGILMRGNLFRFGGADTFETLGFLADVGRGIFYFLAPEIGAAGPAASHAPGDY